MPKYKDEMPTTPSIIFFGLMMRGAQGLKLLAIAATVVIACFVILSAALSPAQIKNMDESLKMGAGLSLLLTLLSLALWRLQDFLETRRDTLVEDENYKIWNTGFDSSEEEADKTSDESVGVKLEKVQTSATPKDKQIQPRRLSKRQKPLRH